MQMCQAAPAPALQLMWQNTAMHVNDFGTGVGRSKTMYCMWSQRARVVLTKTAMHNVLHQRASADGTGCGAVVLQLVQRLISGRVRKKSGQLARICLNAPRSAYASAIGLPMSSVSYWARWNRQPWRSAESKDASCFCAACSGFGTAWNRLPAVQWSDCTACFWLTGFDTACVWCASVKLLAHHQSCGVSLR